MEGLRAVRLVAADNGEVVTAIGRWEPVASPARDSSASRRSATRVRACLPQSRRFKALLLTTRVRGVLARDWGIRTLLGACGQPQAQDGD